jgi:hypothetical protein
MATDFDPEQIVRQVTDNLQKKFPKQDHLAIETQVRAAVDDLKNRPIHDYVAVLAERTVKQSLKQHGESH